MIKDAEPHDPIKKIDGLWHSDDRIFISGVALKVPEARIEFVTSHPLKLNAKLYYLSPFKLWSDYFEMYKKGEFKIETDLFAFKEKLAEISRYQIGGDS